MPRRWKIYYSNGETVSGSSLKEAEDAPGYGLICVVQDDPAIGRNIVSRWDYYMLHKPSGEFWGGDLVGTLHNFAEQPSEFGALKIGQMVSREDYQRILGIAIKDPEFAPVSDPGSVNRVPAVASHGENQ